MITKKGQGAMEYLMTYGWAILVVIIVGVVLWQMGIFNPSGGTAPGSSGFGSVRPKDWSCQSTGGVLQVQWVNGAGEQIKLLDTMPDGGCVDAAGADILVNGSVSANAIVTCTYDATVGCDGIGAGNRFEATATLTWQPAAGGIIHTESGKVWKAAEA